MTVQRPNGLTLAAGLLSAALAGAVSGTPAFANDACNAGVPAPYCQYFVQYQVAPRPLDMRLKEGLGVTDPSQTRSIALVIAIEHYPNNPGHDLKAARVDGERLQKFLIEDQKFDEVILLKDNAATHDNIDYFLTIYFPKIALEFNNKARLLVAYSGHGSNESGSAKPQFMLSAAGDEHDNVPSHFYKMSEFSGNVVALAGSYFHILTLINACYGGNFFGVAQSGGSSYAWTKPGAYAVTAGDTRTTVPSLDENRGSLFFDLLISGVQSGSADEYSHYFSSFGGAGETLSQGGIARTGAVLEFLSTAFDLINHQRAGDRSFETLSDPWIGPAQQGSPAAGAFFFLTGHTLPAQDVAAVLAPYTHPVAHTALADARFGLSEPTGARGSTNDFVQPDRGRDARPPQPVTQTPFDDTSIPLGPVSGVPGHPEIKVFKPPEIYPISGFDLSSADGAVDWTAFSTTNHPNFIYARAIGWAGHDKRFADIWSGSLKAGADRGAYLKFDFCRTTERQIADLKTIVPPLADMLPMALELVTPEPTKDPTQFACWKSLGVNGAKTRILRLAEAIEKTYAKTPLIAGNRYNLGALTDARFDRFMIWLYAYGAQAGALKLGGASPWTIWQYSGSQTVRGVGPSTTAEVFFGTPAQYAEFKSGRGNVALKAVE
jgi:lysozyme